jgi:hypothetical protein
MAKKVSRLEMRRQREQLLERRAAGNSLPPELRSRAERFVPQTIDTTEWEAVRPLFLAIIESTSVRGADAFSKRCIALAGYLAWAAGEGFEMSIEALMRSEPIDEHARALAGRNPATRRSHLRSLARDANPAGMPVAPMSYSHAVVRAPYTAAETAAIERIALHQPTTVQRRGMCAVVGLGLGAGLDSPDLRYLHGGDLDDRGDRDGIWVEVPGPRPRVVPVRRRWEPLVRIGVDGVSRDALVIGRETGRRNVAAKIIEKATILGTDPPKIEPSRMRTTWLADLLTSNVPLQVVMAVSGLTTARSIVEILDHLDATADAEVAR